MRAGCFFSLELKQNRLSKNNILFFYFLKKLTSLETTDLLKTIRIYDFHTIHKVFPILDISNSTMSFNSNYAIIFLK